MKDLAAFAFQNRRAIAFVKKLHLTPYFMIAVAKALPLKNRPTDFKPSRNVIPSLNSRIPPRLSEELRTRGDNADRGCDAPDINIQSMPATTVFPGDFEHRLAPRQHEVGLCLEFAWCIAKVPRAGE